MTRFLLPFPRIGEDRLEVIIKSSGILLPHFSYFINNFVFHLFSTFPSILPACK